MLRRETEENLFTGEVTESWARFTASSPLPLEVLLGLLDLPLQLLLGLPLRLHGLQHALGRLLLPRQLLLQLGELLSEVARLLRGL